MLSGDYQSTVRFLGCTALAVVTLIAPVSVHTHPAPANNRLRTAPSQARRTRVSFRPHIENAANGTPTGWGQVLWPSAQTAWAWEPGWPAQSQGGLVAHTVDDGKIWDWWYTPDTAWYQMASMGPSTASFMGQTVPPPNARHRHVSLVWLDTTNGGATWTQWVLQTPPGGSGSAAFPHARFHAMGELVGGQFWWSHAGGEWETTWPKRDRVSAIAPIQGGGEAVALKTRAARTALYRLTVNASGRITLGPAEATPCLVTGMDWLNVRDGWIWSRSRIWDTSNGGRSWTELSRLPDGHPATLYMASGAIGYAAAGQYGAGPAWDATQLWSTSNGGRTWIRVTLPTITYRLPNVTLSLVGFYVASVTMQKLTLWYGPITPQGVPQRIWTTNYGKTWRRSPNNPPEPH